MKRIEKRKREKEEKMKERSGGSNEGHRGTEGVGDLWDLIWGLIADPNFRNLR